MRISEAGKKAIMIGSLCSLSYLAVYVARNMLGAISPQIIADGVFTTEMIGRMSSIYFIAYAIGQLINGFLGEKIKASHMISMGLILAGTATTLFSVLFHNLTASYVSYGLTGFFLSMIYAPMTKVVAENTEPLYAPRCSLGYTFASFFGSPLAGLLAAILMWQQAIAITGGVLIIMGAVSFAGFLIMERKGIVRYGTYTHPKTAAGGLRILIQHQIIKFTLVSAITGVVRTTVVFWLPTYIVQYLGFSPKDSALIFSVATFFISMTVVLTSVLYEWLHRDLDLVVLVAFVSASICFLLVFFVKAPLPNVIIMVLAILSANIASSIMWIRYCPGLRDTGMVSTATGFLDFVSYMAASAASTLFANAVTNIGWAKLILVWFGLMVVGVLVALPRKKEQESRSCNP